MNPDPKESLPREILEELLEEGAEAFRSVLEKLLKLAIAEMYVKEVSTRKVSQITEQPCGTEISATPVSRIARLLDYLS